MTLKQGCKAQTRPVVWMVTCIRDGESEELLRAAASERGYQLVALHPGEILSAAKSFDDGSVPNGSVPTAALWGLGAAADEAYLKVVSVLNAHGVPVVNSLQCICLCRDKYQTYKALGLGGIPTPETYLPSDISDPLSHPRALGSWVVKPRAGSKGQGVERITSLQGALDLITGKGQASDAFLIQECVDESLGTDIRVLVLNGQAVVAARRVAMPGEFRANVDLGATAYLYDMDDRVRAIAVGAAHAVGGEFVGVDLLLKRTGPVVTEVNAAPELGIISRLSHLDIAGALFDYLALSS